MAHEQQFYIDGAWVEPIHATPHAVIDPTTEELFAEVALGSAADIDRAVAAARTAFAGFAATTVQARIALIERVLAALEARKDEFAYALTKQIGAPTPLARQQGEMAAAHLRTTIDVLRGFAFERIQGSLKVVKEPIGVVGCITPWNAPVSQILCKAIPAMAAGCTTVVKPSELAPLSALLLAEVMDEAGVPKGVFNLVLGDGKGAGPALASHPDVDMVSFTGSVGGGRAVGRASAETIKRVCLELGGKSANIILEDADLKIAVPAGVMGMFFHSGQTCGAPSRMFAPRHLHDQVVAIACETAAKVVVGKPEAPGTDLGPLVSRGQFDRVQAMIQSGIDEGAELAAGGVGRPEGLNRGYFARPTIFANVDPAATIAREEIFGPVLSILAYDSEEEAVRLANDSPYGLVGYVQSGDPAHGAAVAAQIRAGYVSINHPPMNLLAPFGGYKQSGNGRQLGEYALDEVLELKALVRAEPW